MSNKYVFLVKIQGSDWELITPLTLAFSAGNLPIGLPTTFQTIPGGYYHKYQGVTNAVFEMSPKERRDELIKTFMGEYVSLGTALQIKHNYLFSLLSSQQRMITVKIIPRDRAIRIITQIPLKKEEHSGLGRTIHRLRKLKENQKERSRDKLEWHGRHHKF